MLERFERFSYGIFEISRCWHRLAAEEMEKYGLKGPYAVYLLALQRSKNGITAAQLCEICARDKADVSRAVRAMEEKGLVCREGSSYRALLKLTSTGKTAARHIYQRVSVAVEYAGKGFSDQHRETFYQVLDTITANLQVLCREGLPNQ